MSVLGYLQQAASDTLLTPSEQSLITRSIAALKQNLDAHFANDIKAQVRFGSSTRGTNLPRLYDDSSDVDYMVVFQDDGSAPQTYLDRLRRFVEGTRTYSRSVIRQSHPTIVLELSHIQFDLVPAVHSWWSGLRIPDRGGSWQSTDPDAFNQTLTERNGQCGNQLKPAIRLVKRWNAANNYPFESFALEQWITQCNYWTCANLRDYVLAIFDKMSPTSGAQRAMQAVERAKQRVATIRRLQEDGNESGAERELAKLIP